MADETLTARAERLMAVYQQKLDQRGRWEADRRYSEAVKAQKIAALDAEISEYTSGVLTEEIANAAERRYAAIRERRQRAFAAGQLSDALTNPVAREDARKRAVTLSRRALNLAEFEGGYDQAGSEGDVYLQRVYQTEGAELARERWPSEGGLGSFEARMKRDYEAYFLGEEADAIRADLVALRDDIRGAYGISRELYRSGLSSWTGMQNQSPSAPDRRLEALLYEVGGALGQGNAGGGAYLPVGGKNRKWVIEGVGGLLGNAG